MQIKALPYPFYRRLDDSTPQLQRWEKLRTSCSHKSDYSLISLSMASTR